MAAPPQALMDEIIEEFLLRLPPAEPAVLVHAALVCKPWCRLISSLRFRRRFRAFHRTAPMLGFVCNNTKGAAPYVARFVPTSAFRPPHADHLDWIALDARHGYVLLTSVDDSGRLLVVWDPITDKRWQLPPLFVLPLGWNATVLCTPSGTGDHLDCIHRSFIVVLVSSDFWQTTLRVYLSESGSWSEETLVPGCGADEMPAALVGNTIYFSVNVNSRILSYDLATKETSVICLPPKSTGSATALMAMEDGVLGIARAEGSRLSLWSMEENSHGDIGWAQIRVIELEKLLPVKALPISSNSIVFAPGIGVLLVHGDDGIFTIDLKSDRVKKVLEIDNQETRFVNIVPYLSFYTPALGSITTDEGPGVDASSA